jgi:hypothetical protein
MITSTQATDHTTQARPQDAAEAYFAALASLRAGGETGRFEAARLLLPIAADAKAGAVRHRARVALKQHFGAVVEDMTPEFAAEVAAIEAERLEAATKARADRQPWHDASTANDNARTA